MSAMWIAITIIIFFILIFLQVPIAMSLGMASLVYIFGSDQMPILQGISTMVKACDSFPLLAIPLFILTGGIIEGGGLGKRLVDFVGSIVGHVTGGYAIVTILTCMLFGAISGSAIATVAAIGGIMVPVMLEHGYDKKFAYGLICAAGCLGILIPPSVPLILYSTASNDSVAALFMGGFGPGILCAVMLCVFAYFLCRKHGYLGSGQKFSLKNVWKTFKSAFWALLIPVIILGGIYGGFFTPTEAAAVAAVYSLFASVVIYREFKWKEFNACFGACVTTCGSILVILLFATLFGRVMTLAQLPIMIQSFLVAHLTAQWQFLIVCTIILLIIGCVMDITPAILILAPILTPIAVSFGVSSVQMGLIMVLNLGIGLCTPPVGGNLYVAASIGNMKFEEICRGVIPFLIAMILSLLLVTFIPDISLGLPKFFGMM